MRFRIPLPILVLLFVSSKVRSVLGAIVQVGTTCTVTPLSADGGTGTGTGTSLKAVSAAAAADDTPQIITAFKNCGINGDITFLPGTYSIQKILDTTLRNSTVILQGRWVWSTDIAYWLRSSISVVYAGRSTAWRIGGEDFRILGRGVVFDGNGQTWYDQNRNAGNQNGRPISFTLWKAKNAVIDGITWRQSQFWHTFIAHSENITMTNMDMNSTSNSQWKTVNTDGTDTWNSKNIVISNWTVSCGDDCISVKANSTNIHVSNIVCHESGGMCVGSIGKDAGVTEIVENVLFENVSLTHSSNAAWIKTYPSGPGRVRNVTFRNIKFTDVNQPIYISPCIYSYTNCDSSRLQISDVRWENISGTARYNIGAGIHCSGAAKCQNLTFEGIDIKQKSGAAVEYLCSNIVNQKTMGLACTGSCPANQPQQLNHT